MKLTNNELKQIIKEELEAVMQEQELGRVRSPRNSKMKIANNELKKIIKEELEAVMTEMIRGEEQ